VNFGGIQAVVPLTSSGLVANGLLSHTLAKPGGYLSPLDLAATGDLLSLGLSYPIIARPGLTTLATFSFDAFNNSATVYGGQLTTSDERSRAVRFGVLNTYLDPLGGTSVVKATYSQGIDGLGARPNGDQINPRPGIHLNAGKFLLDLRYDHPLPLGFKVSAGLRGLYGLAPLPSAELFTFGGVDYGRAYDSGIISGDRGYSGKIQVSRPMPLGNPFVPFLEPYLFYDNGEAFSILKTPGVSSSASAASAGIGTRFLTGLGVGGYVEADRPLTHAAQINSKRKPDRLFFLIFAQF
jgi:hemolysin activation/secretion protein